MLCDVGFEAESFGLVVLLPESSGPDFEAGALEKGEFYKFVAEAPSYAPFFPCSVELHTVDAAGDDVLASQSGAEHHAVMYVDDEVEFWRGKLLFYVAYGPGVERRKRGEQVFSAGVGASEGAVEPVGGCSLDAGAEGFLCFCHGGAMVCPSGEGR